MVTTFVIGLVTSLAVQTTEIPLEEFSAPNAFFACLRAGIPGLGIDYDEMHREMDFGRFDEPVTHFTLDDPIKSVTYEGDGTNGRWVIRAEGLARNARGSVANGTPVRIGVVVHRVAGAVGTADFEAHAGTYRQNEAGCRNAPPRPRPGHMQ